MTVRVVTDSTADLPPDVAQALDIAVVPLNVHFGQEAYRDGIDITAEEFFPRLVSSPALPKTSQPSVGDFLQVYQEVGRQSDGILSIHISSKLSGTYNSAINAAGAYEGGPPVEVIDSQMVSVALGMAVLVAARAAQKSASLEQVTAEARQALQRTHLLFFLDTLEYLEKGGRIGKARAMLGSLLHIKPILTIREGEIHPAGKARTRTKAVDRVTEMVQELGPLEEAGVVYSTTPEEAEELAQRVRRLSGNPDILLSRIGPVLGTYAGPGCLGVTVRTR